MSTSAILTGGFGTFGGVTLIPTLGFVPGSGPAPPEYDTLLAAALATLKAALVSGSLTGIYDQVPRTLALPYATIAEVGNSRQYTDTSGG